MTGWTPRTSGIAIVCDLHGTVRTVVRGTVGSLEGGTVRGPLTGIVDEGSREKAAYFLNEVRASGATAAWEINLPSPSGPHSWWFSGARGDGELLVTATLIPDQTIALLQELQHSGEFRHSGAHPLVAPLLREVERRIRLFTPETADVLNELSRVNNELVNAQRELALLNARLRELNDERERFMGIAAHDLNTPLAVIRLYCELLIRGAGDQLSPEHVRMLRIIQDTSGSMADIVRDFLDVTTMSSGRLRLRREELDVAEFLLKKMGPFRQQARSKGIPVEFSQKAPSPVVHADRSKLDQAVTNLVSNAIKFSPPGASVLVELSAGGGEAVIGVVDNGPGIPPEEISKLFKPFSRTSVEPTQGERSTGLGLAITKGLIEAHGGSVEVESERGHGSTFRIRLPLTQGNQTSA